MVEFSKIIFNGYKCFKEDTILNDIKPINIIIGKNNIGKSSILDIIELINNNELLSSNKQIDIILDKEITEKDIATICHRGHSGGVFKKQYRENYNNLDNYQIGEKFIGQRIGFHLKARKENQNYNQNITYTFYTSFNKDQVLFNKNFDKVEEDFYSKLSEKLIYNTKTIKRIYAERNIVPEVETSSMEISGFGNGITSVINNYLNKDKFEESLVKIDLLNKLNEIMGEDAHFTEIVTQQIENGETTKWEVFLREDQKGRIALSQSGSGLKTILMVLVYTILIPNIEKDKKLSDYIFLFEELENNLHPSLERRLLKYIEDLTTKGTTIFLTTHSNTILDSFQSNDNVQIYHIIKENNKINVKVLDSILGKNSCLNDIGIKASDILQSNGVIWVEGPSDRIYLNKWIELWSNGEYKEGFDYSCVFYGGRLLSNITFDTDNIDELVNLMLVNKNSIVLIDSDRKKKGERINDTKNRIKTEFEKNKQFCMITQGREIENYIPFDVIKKQYPKSKNFKFGQYDDIKSLLNKMEKNESKRFERDKKGYSQKFIEYMTYENMKSVLDLDSNMKKVIEQIKEWNNK